MRRLAFTILLVLISLIPPGADAKPFVPKMNKPETIKDYLFSLDEARKNIESVSCGGWVDNEGVTVAGETVNGGDIPIPEITGVPGRKNVNPLADPKTGIGGRGAFEYPDEAYGFMSACDVVNQTTINDPDLAAAGKKIQVNGDGTVEVVDGNGDIDLNKYKWCVRMDGATPTLCKKLFDALQQMGPKLDAAGARPNIGDPLCPEPKKFCFDFNAECRGQTCRTLTPPGFSQTTQTCHAETAGDGTVSIVIDSPGSVNAVQSSFYRHYAGEFGQAGLEVKTDPDFEPQKTWKLRVECYEYYKERNLDGSDFDPKTIVTGKKDEQCEIILTEPTEREPAKPEWPDGENKQKQKVKADPPIDEPDRALRTVPDPWVADKETNLSLLDMKKLKEKQKGFTDPSDITSVLATILPAKQRASKTVPKNARADALDDSDTRDFVTFWEAQQRLLLKMTTDPQTRLIMPARFLVGLAEDDPLFQYVKHSIARSDGTVEITLRAGPEDLANVLASFRQIFIAPIQEIRIPVLAPLASGSEINALIFQWESWKREEDIVAARDGRASKAAQADPIINRLKEYRDQADGVRKLRGALPKYLTKLYPPQEEIRQFFADWYDNLSAQLLLAIQRAEQRRELKRIWRLTDRSLLQTAACQILWCSNQRYSVAVYSLLDNWWGTIPPGGIRNPDVTPADDLRNVAYLGTMDAVYDFSNMKFPREPLLVPALWVVQVSVKLPSPPRLGVDPPPVSTLPALPSIPNETVFNTFSVPAVTLPLNPPTITMPITPDLEPAKVALRNIRKMIDGTDIPEQLVEEEELKNGESIDDGGYPVDKNKVIDRDSMRGAYCRLPQSILIPPDSNDKIYQSDPAEVDHSDTTDEKGNAAKIIHVENDLQERIARLISRWMPQRTEDYAGRVARRNAPLPLGTRPSKCFEDVICAFLPPESTTTTRWQWFMPTSSTDDFNTLADTLRDDGLPVIETNNPYRGATIETLSRIFSTLRLPVLIQLFPAPPAP